METKQRPNYEYKSLVASLSDVDVSSGIVTGYFAAFGNIDSDGDMIMPGAFKKTIKERGPKGANQIFHLLMHNPMMVIGKPSLLEEDEKGLKFETKVPGTTLGKDSLILYEAGVYNEHSIGYRCMKWQEVEQAGQENYYKLIEIKLWEGSTVNWGANDQTPFTGFKSAEERANALTQRKTALFKALKVGGLTDDTYIQLELMFEQLTNELKSLQEPDKTIPEAEPITLTDNSHLWQKLTKIYN